MTRMSQYKKLFQKFAAILYVLAGFSIPLLATVPVHADPSEQPAVICGQSGGTYKANDRSGAFTCTDCPAGKISDGKKCNTTTTTPAQTNQTDAQSSEDDPTAVDLQCDEQGDTNFGQAGVCTGQKEVKTSHTCGKGTDGSGKSLSVAVSFDFGCRGESYSCPAGVLNCTLNPITDILFALFRVLSAGVGIVVAGSIIVAGIQYAAARGNPQMSEAAIKRVTNSLIGLLLYVFLFAIANFIVPGGMFL